MGAIEKEWIMATALLECWENLGGEAGRAPVIGMVHLGALPGAPGFKSDLGAVRAAAVADAQALCEGGVDGLMIENYGDVPFYPGKLPAETVAGLTAMACAVRAEVDLPLGINALRNDGCAAMGIAKAVDAQFVRVNVLSGARVTDQGIVEGIAHELLRLRKSLGAEDVKILADVNVKHSAPLGEGKLEDEVADLIHRGCADAVIVTGAGTGCATDREELVRVKAVAGGTPVFVGSGVTGASAKGLIESGADGLIVGSWLKEDGDVGRKVDVERVRELMGAVENQ